MRTSLALSSVKYQSFIQLPFFQNPVHMQCIIWHDGSWSTRVNQPVIQLPSKNLCLWKKWVGKMAKCSRFSHLPKQHAIRIIARIPITRHGPMREKCEVFTQCNGMKESTCLKDTYFHTPFREKHVKWQCLLTWRLALLWLVMRVQTKRSSTRCWLSSF